MNVGAPTSKIDAVFRIGKVRSPIILPRFASARRKLHFPNERDRLYDLHLTPFDTRSERAIGRHHIPAAPARRALDDQLVRTARRTEHGRDRSEMTREARRLGTIEDACDARLLRTRECAEETDETALRVVAVPIDAHRSENVAAVNQPGHVQSAESGGRSAFRVQRAERREYGSEAFALRALPSALSRFGALRALSF